MWKNKMREKQVFESLLDSLGYEVCHNNRSGYYVVAKEKSYLSPEPRNIEQARWQGESNRDEISDLHFKLRKLEEFLGVELKRKYVKEKGRQNERGRIKNTIR